MKWQPIETAPAETAVLLSVPADAQWVPAKKPYVVIGVRWSEGWVDDQGRMDPQPSHWMPLPDPR